MMNSKPHAMYHGNLTRCLWRTWSSTARWGGLALKRTMFTPRTIVTNLTIDRSLNTANPMHSDLIKIFHKMNSLSAIPILSATFYHDHNRSAPHRLLLTLCIPTPWTSPYTGEGRTTEQSTKDTLTQIFPQVCAHLTLQSQVLSLHVRLWHTASIWKSDM